MRKDTPLERLYNGIIKENPTFVMMLGMCPTLAVTTSAKNGIGMGLATMVILTASNLMISLLRKIIPDGVRMPAYIVVVASFVTIVEFLMEGFIPALYSAIDISIAVRRTIGIPLNDSGISLYSIFSRRPAISTMAIVKPIAVARP